MRKAILISSTVLLLVFIAVILQFQSPSSSEDIITLTKALCNSTNYCQDYEIQCVNNQLVNQIPITGAVVQHSPDWKDRRNLTNLCS
ncbi:MAG: hypothetical protein NT076_04910 [Candidatus Pacearchaeota archaeon]|nr:hypothetical protein [Candidatus Pacearchaeota archaeon]